MSKPLYLGAEALDDPPHGVVVFAEEPADQSPEQPEQPEPAVGGDDEPGLGVGPSKRTPDIELGDEAEKRHDLKPQIGHNIRFQAPISTRSA